MVVQPKFLTICQCYEQFSYFCVVKLLKQVFDFYLDASIHVALSVLSLIYVTSLLLPVSFDENLALFIFFGTIACYNFIKYGVEAKKYILVANKYHKNIQVVSFIALAAAAYFATKITINVWIAIGVLVLFTGLYALPVLPKAKNFRSLGGLKIFVVALVWAGATVLLPVISSESIISWDIGIETLQRFLLVLVLLLPFEIRDLKYDEPELKTLPQRYGITRSKAMGLLWAITLFICTYLKDDLTILDILAKATLLFGFGLMLYVTQRNQSKYFSSFWVEAIPIFWLGIVYVLSKMV